jgi:hypothetical protein
MSDIQTEIEASIVELQDLYPNYLSNIQNKIPNQLARNTLTSELSDTNRALEEYDRVEEVYDREFIDRTENPPSVGLFSNLGLITTQDWVLAYFYISYILFSILFFIVTIKSVKHKMPAAIFILFITFIVGVLITTMITKFA